MPPLPENSKERTSVLAKLARGDAAKFKVGNRDYVATPRQKTTDTPKPSKPTK